MNDWKIINEQTDQESFFDTEQAARDEKRELLDLFDESVLRVEPVGNSQSQEDTAESTESETSPKQPDVVEREQMQREAVESQMLEQAQVAAEKHAPDTIDDPEQFVTEVKGVPQTFVVNMGTPDNKSIHIKKEGYYYLAAQMDLQMTVEPYDPTWEGDSDTAAYKGIVVDDDGRTWTNVGTAHKQGEDMQGAAYNLDELAATRAATRALSMATGTGVASMEEMIQGDE